MMYPMYKQCLKTKIIRTLHEVRFSEGITAENIKRALANGPDSARLIETDYESEHGCDVLAFEEEVAE